MKLRPLVIALGLAGLAACSTAPIEPGQTMPQRPADVTVLPDGLAYKVLRKGEGKVHPKLTDTVTANYSLWFPNGEMIESSCKPPKPCDPATFPLDKLIPGWQEMLPLMSTGETVDLWLPVQLAYGDPPRKPNRPFGPLVFEIQMIDIGRPLPPPDPEQK